jgi:hypothetical protein
MCRFVSDPNFDPANTNTFDMKTQKPVIRFFFLFCLISNLKSFSQDTIQKVNGEYVFCKVMEIGTKTVSYKKQGMEDGPSFTEELKMVANIRYKSGHRDDYKHGKIEPPKLNLPRNTAMKPSEEKLPSVLAGSQTSPGSNPADSGSSDNPGNPGNANKSGSQMPGNSSVPGSTENTALKNGPLSNQYRIDHFDNKYLINNQKVSSKAVDKLLASSSNPMVVTMAKSAKILKKTQKAMKIVSFPSTIAGGFASIGTFTSMYNEIQKGPVSFNSCKDFGLSFLGTLTGPITSKLLKKKTGKMYDKTIALYNMQN